MSKSIEERIVSMQFNNSNFEQKVSQSMSTLNKLKEALKFKNASKGIDDISTSANKLTFNGMISGLDNVTAKFSALQVMGMTALANITNAAVNAGKNIASALTIKPIYTGFQEYETQINAVQTILANTESKGSTLKDVNKALDELNKYADQTIYNFTEMTRNIGTFTAAGVDLDKSVSSIKGIANLAAVSGSTSQQASTAMYQLSQALAAGKVQLMDWNSVVNAGMGGEVFQTALKRTAKQMGHDVDGLIKKYGSFRESLTKGEWLTADVLTETLTQLSGAYTEADLIAKGYTKEQAKEITKLAETAVNAATKVKTFTQLWDTLQEAAQSGWTQTWEILIGDFEEAKELLTGISDTVSDFLNKQSDARNSMLQTWKDMGGRKDVLESFKNMFEGVLSVVKPINEAFRDIFPPMTAGRLYEITKSIKEFTENLKLSDENAKKLKETFKGVFSVFSILGKGISAVVTPIFKFFGDNGGTILSGILSITSGIGRAFTTLNYSLTKDGGLDAFSDFVTNVLGSASGVIKMVTGNLESLGDALSSVGDFMSKVIGGIGKSLASISKWLTDNITPADIFAGLAGGGIYMAATRFADLVDQVSDSLSGLFKSFSKGSGKFQAAMETLKETLTAFSSGVKVASIMAIAISVSLLSSAMERISNMDIEQVAFSLGAIGLMMVMLNSSFRKLTKILDTFKPKKLISAGIAMMAMAKALGMLVDVIREMGSIPLDKLAVGLLGMYGAMIGLTAAMKGISKVKINLKASVAMLAIAKTMKTLSEVMKDLGKMSWEEIKRSLTAMGGALLEMAVVMKLMSKFGGFKTLAGSTSILITAQALGDISKAMADIGDMEWSTIGKGLSGIGGALTEIALVNGLLGRFGGMSSLASSTSIVITAKALDEIGDALADVGSMDWEDIGKGLTGIGGALAEIALVNGTLGKLGGMSSLASSTSIVITANALKDIGDALLDVGSMDWDQIGTGLAGLGGALAEIAVVNGALGKFAGLSSIFASISINETAKSLGDIAKALADIGKLSWDEIKKGLSGMGGALVEIGIVNGAVGALAGFSSLFGSTSILITIQGLADLADALKKFGGMSWEEIKMGLTGLGGSLAIVGGMNTIIGKIGGFASLLGGGSILLTIQGLGDLADALKKFGSMSWDEIKKGLTSMTAALGATGLGGLLNSLSGLGAISISAMAEPLGQLADSVKKWEGVSIPAGLPLQLGALAAGIIPFTTGIIGAAAIRTVAEPLGTMAESVKKWSGVTVPSNLGTNLGQLADGVRKFTFGGFGAGTLAKAAEPLGVLATSVKKWEKVTVPEGMDKKLGSLADGVKAFTWAFVGGFSIDTVVGPLGKLAGSVAKWKNVDLPWGMGDKLSSLAEGVKAFTPTFFAGWSIGNIVGPLGQLAGAVKKWSRFSIPMGIDLQLSSLARGLMAFKDVNLDNFQGELISKAITNLNSTVKTLNSLGEINVNAITNFTNALNQIGQISVTGLVTSLQNGVSELGPAIANIINTIKSTIVSNIPTIVPAAQALGKATSTNIKVGLETGTAEIKSIIDQAVATVNATLSNSAKQFGISGASIGAAIKTGLGQSLNGLADIISCEVSKAISGVSDKAASLGPIGVQMANSLSNGFKSGGGGIVNAANEIMAATITSISSKGSNYTSEGSTLMTKLASGISGSAGKVKTAVNKVVSNATSGLRSYYSSFYSAGQYVAQGFANGISAGTYAAAAKARAMAKAASDAAKKQLDEHSPSKVFYKIGDFAGQGFVNALNDSVGSSYKSGKEMAKASMDGLSRALGGIGDLTDDIDANPVIRPVVDLTEVQAGASAISGLLNNTNAVGVRARQIGGIVNRRQNGVTNEVVSAIKDLKKAVNSVGGTTYNVNGITYDDGSNVSSAVQSLIRAAKIERRV